MIAVIEYDYGKMCDILLLDNQLGLLRFFFAKREIETLVVWFVVLFLLF